MLELQSGPQVKHAVVPRAALILLLVLLAYLPAIRGGFIWDDDAYLTDNPEMTNPVGWHQIWLEKPSTHQYYPLVLSSFRLERHLWGLNPMGYHLVNVLFHSLNAILLGVLLRQLGVPGGWIAALLFALHPVMVESVAWITERKNVMSGTFYLLAFLSYLKSEPLLREENPDAPRKLCFYLLSLGLFLGALLSKTVTCSLPVLIGIALWWKHGKITFRQIAPLIPFLGLGAGLGLGTAWIEKTSLGAQGSQYTLSLLERTLLAGRCLWFYVGKLILPVDLTFIYPHWTIRATNPVLYLYPLSFLSLLAFLWAFRARIGRGPLAAFLAFAITLFPALGFVDVFPFRFSYVADHFQYLASAALLALAGAGISGLDRINKQFRPWATWALATLFGMLTWVQAGNYTSLEVLWRDTLEKNPEAHIAHFNLGNLLARKGKLLEAIEHYSECLRIQPGDYQAYGNRAGILLQLGREAEARSDYLAGLKAAQTARDAQAQVILSECLKKIAPEKSPGRERIF